MTSNTHPRIGDEAEAIEQMSDEIAEQEGEGSDDERAYPQRAPCPDVKYAQHGDNHNMHEIDNVGVAPRRGNKPLATRGNLEGQ